MPRTIAGACARVYEFVPAVWCTTASLSVAAITGLWRTISSSAPQPERSTIAGPTAVLTARVAFVVTRDHNSYARSACTAPCVRNLTRSDAPVQSRLPSWQRPVPPSGRTSSSTAVQACHRSWSRCARYSTVPLPVQWTPSMLKCIGGVAAASPGEPSGTSWTRIATSPARATAGARSAVAAAVTATSFSIVELSQRYETPADCGFHARAPPSCDCGSRPAGAGDPFRFGGQPRNPGLAEQPARRRPIQGLRRRRDRPGHTRGPRGVDAQDRPEGALAEDPRDRLRLARRRAPGLGRRLDLPGGGPARHGAADEHRVVDP